MSKIQKRPNFKDVSKELKSLVWKHMKKDCNANKALCVVLSENGDPCGIVLPICNSGTDNLSSHLFNYHNINIFYFLMIKSRAFIFKNLII